MWYHLKSVVLAGNYGVFGFLFDASEAASVCGTALIKIPFSLDRETHMNAPVFLPAQFSFVDLVGATSNQLK